MMGYSPVFAQFYDSLTGNVGYGEKADFLLQLAGRFGYTDGQVLDLACGTGSLAVELARRGQRVIGVDASSEMLSLAAAKSGEYFPQVFYLCQTMEQLELHRPVDLCLCILDSLNHLPGKEALIQTFQRVAQYTKPGGLFIFDMNTPYKHRYVLGNNAFVYERRDFVFCWQNEYAPQDGSVEISLDFFVREEGERYRRMRECFREYCYTQEEIVAIARQAGFEVLEQLGDYHLSPPSAEEERVLYVARRG